MTEVIIKALLLRLSDHLTICIHKISSLPTSFLNWDVGREGDGNERRYGLGEISNKALLLILTFRVAVRWYFLNFIVLNNTMPYHATTYDVIRYDMVLCLAMSCHVMSYHLILRTFLCRLNWISSSSSPSLSSTNSTSFSLLFSSLSVFSSFYLFLSFFLPSSLLYFFLTCLSPTLLIPPTRFLSLFWIFLDLSPLLLFFHISYLILYLLLSLTFPLPSFCSPTLFAMSLPFSYLILLPSYHLASSSPFYYHGVRLSSSLSLHRTF